MEHPETMTPHEEYEAWTFAANYLSHLVEAAHLIGSEELNLILERAEGEALAEKGRAQDRLERA
jgi:hypothetical protein